MARPWLRVTSRGVRLGGSLGRAFRLGASVGTGGLRASGSVKAGRARVGRSVPVGGSKRRRSVTWLWWS
jgi:hypothetical protein